MGHYDGVSRYIVPISSINIFPMLVKRETEGHNIKASLRAVQNEQEINFEIKRKSCCIRMH